MSTRANIIIYDGEIDKSNQLVIIGKHYDGYPSDLGVTLLSFLKNRKICNGFSASAPKLSNGMGCLSASLIKHLKEETGDVYILYKLWDLSEYLYYIYYSSDKIFLKITIPNTIEETLIDRPIDEITTKKLEEM
jgi:hypothetical protein